MKEIFLILVVGILNLLSFCLGSKTSKGEEIQLKNPIEQYQEYKNEKNNTETYEQERKILETNLENIENFDGTSLGQKDFE